MQFNGECSLPVFICSTVSVLTLTLDLVIGLLAESLKCCAQWLAHKYTFLNIDLFREGIWSGRSLDMRVFLRTACVCLCLLVWPNLREKEMASNISSEFGTSKEANSSA